MDEEKFALNVEVLLEIIHGAKVEVEPSAIAARLAARGISVTAAQVETLLKEHGLKKTAKSHWRPSRR
jgi:arginine repressor